MTDLAINLLAASAPLAAAGFWWRDALRVLRRHRPRRSRW